MTGYRTKRTKTTTIGGSIDEKTEVGINTFSRRTSADTLPRFSLCINQENNVLAALADGSAHKGSVLFMLLDAQS